MKKRLIICLILVGLFAITYNIMPILADSGFDASFDSDSSGDGNNSGVCKYCKSTLISNNYTLVLSKKKMISQK